MIKRFSAACSLGLILAACHVAPADAQEIELYVDTASKNRVKMGTFQQVRKDSGQQTKKKNSGQPAQRDSSQQAQKEPGPSFVHEPLPVRVKDEHWYDRIHIRGYTQFRTATTVSGDKDAVVYWPDKSVGEDTSFFIRRARLIFYGDVTDNLYVYLQPDFASTPSGSSTGNFGQLRDATPISPSMTEKNFVSGSGNQKSFQF